MRELWLYIASGLTGGGAYALTALGVVTVYRGSGVLNFAQGAIGMAGVYAYKDLANNHAPIAISLLVGVLAGALLGCLFYFLVIRRMTGASDLAKTIATLGLLLFLQAAATWHYGSQTTIVSRVFSGPTLSVFGAKITTDEWVILLALVAASIVLALLFNKTKYGLRSTAIAEAPTATAAVGISPHGAGFISWGIGGGVSALAAILILPLTGLSAANMTLTIVPAFAAALLGHFRSLWKSMLVGLGIGIAQSVMIDYHVNAGVTQALPFLIIVVALFLGGVGVPARGFQTPRLPRVGHGKLAPVKVAIGIVVVGVIFPLLGSGWDAAVVGSALFGLMALSIILVTGYAGQINLASSAVAGLASLLAAHASQSWGFGFFPCLVVGIVVGISVGILVGIPAVRVRGTNLAVATLGVGFLIQDGILSQPQYTGGTYGITLKNPSIFGYDLNPSLHPARYAWFCLIVFVIVAVAVANIRRGRSGRRYLAIRANERGAAALGISPRDAKLAAFALSAGIAGLAGVLTNFQFQVASFGSFSVFESVTIVAFAVLGGVGYITGSVFAGVGATGGMITYLINFKLGIHSINVWLPIVTGFAVIDVVSRYPDGVVFQFRPLVRAVERLVGAGRRPGDVEERLSDVEELSSGRLSTNAEWLKMCGARSSGSPTGAPALVAKDLRVAYGSTVAVSNVSLELCRGTVTGVIGANGAGKTSLIDAISGFTRTAGGSVALNGIEISARSPRERARLGLVRTFQNLELFEDLTVRENLLAASDRRDILAHISDIVHPGSSELSPVAKVVTGSLGLNDHLDVVVSSLPQGLRRLVAMARVIAQEPIVMCLDEPAAGMAGPERRVASELFRSLARDFNAAVLLVEHNVDVVSEVCDNVVVLDFGRVIAQGAPSAVLADAAVRKAYLGQGGEDDDGREAGPSRTEQTVER